MPSARTQINTEHKAIIAALRKFEIDRLIELCESHRTGGLERAATGSRPAIRAVLQRTLA